MVLAWVVLEKLVIARIIVGGSGEGGGSVLGKVLVHGTSLGEDGAMDSEAKEAQSPVGGCPKSGHAVHGFGFVFGGGLASIQMGQN